MNEVKPDQAGQEKKIADINFRIDAIQKLRGAQQGPGAVLAEIKARFDSMPGLYLRSVEQKDTELVIKGESPNEATVTRFGQSMEFSSGMFTNLNIETQREVAQAVKGPGTTAPAEAKEPKTPHPEVATCPIKHNIHVINHPPQEPNSS